VAPDATLRTSEVPAAVPLLFQSSAPFVPSSAWKKTRPFALVKPFGFELPEPVRMSRTSVVPGAVPSLFQSSVPFTLSLAEMNAVAERSPKGVARSESPVPEVRSRSKVVPAGVPSLFQSSRPMTSSSAAKYARPLKAKNEAGDDGLAPAKTSCKRSVPAALPSLVHGSVR